MAGGNNVEVHINGDEDVSGAAARAAAAIDALNGKKITVDIDFDTKDAEKTLRSLKDEAKTIGDSVGDFDLNTRKARDKLTYLHERAKALGDLETEIDIDTRKARDKLTYLHNRHKEIGDNKPEVDVDTSKARDKFSYLKSRFSDIFSDKPEVDINTKKARDKLSKLGSRVKEVISIKQEIDIDTDKAKEKLNGLNKIGKKLKKINIDVDIDDAVDQIEDLYLAMEHLKNKTINIDVDSGQALAQIAALDSALHGMDGRKKVEVDVDVNDTDMMRWQSELDALNRNKRRIQNNPYELTIPTEIEVDEDRIKDLEKRIADKKNTIKVKTELDNSELEDAGIKDKKVKIDVEINGLERLVALRAVIASLEDKTININVNSDSGAIDRLTNSKNGKTKPITQEVRVVTTDGDNANRKTITQKVVQKIKTEIDKKALKESAKDIKKLRDFINTRNNLDIDIKKAQGELDDLNDYANSKLFRDLNYDRLVDDGKLRKLKKELATLNVQVNDSAERDSLIDNFKKQKQEIEKTPIDVRTDFDKSRLKVIDRSLDELTRERKVFLEVDDDAVLRAKKLSNDIDDLTRANSTGKDAKIKVDADTAAAEAKLAALTRARDVTIRPNVNSSALARMTRGISSVASSTSRIGDGIRRSFDNDRSVGRFARNTTRVMNGVGDVLGGITTPLFKGLAAVTNRIPVVGGLMRGIAGIGNPFAQAAAGAATLGIAAVAATGVAAAGIYAVYAGLGAVAGIAGVAGAAIGGGFIAGFAAIAAQSEQVKTAFSDMGSYVGDTMKIIAQPVEMPLVRAAEGLKGAFDIMRPSLDRIAQGTGNLIDDLTGKLPAIASSLGPALEKTFEAGSKHLSQFATKLPGIIDGVGKFMDKLGSEKTLAGAGKFFDKLPGLISGAGSAIEGLASGFSKMSDYFDSGALDPMVNGFKDFAQNLQNTDFSNLIGGISDMGNAFGEALGQMNTQATADFLGDIASGTADIAAGTADVISGFTAANAEVKDFSSEVNDAFDFNTALADKNGDNVLERLWSNVKGNPTRLISQDTSNMLNGALADVGLIDWEPEVEVRPSLNQNGDHITGTIQKLLPPALGGNPIPVPVSPEIPAGVEMPFGPDGKPLEFPVTPTFDNLGSNTLPFLGDPVELPVNPTFNPTAPILPFLNDLHVPVFIDPVMPQILPPNLGGNPIPLEVVPTLRDFNLPFLPALEVPATVKWDFLAPVSPPPVEVPGRVNFDEMNIPFIGTPVEIPGVIGSIALGAISIPPVPVEGQLQFSDLGLPFLSPIPIPGILDPITPGVSPPPVRVPGSIEFGEFALPAMPVVPPLQIPSVVTPPPTPPMPKVNPLRIPLIFDVQKPNIPKLPDTRSIHHVSVTSDGLPSFPNTGSNHHVSVSSDGLPSFPDTSSTHTVRVQVVGSAGGSATESARSNPNASAFSGPLARGIAPMSMGAIGPMGASGISSGGRGVQAIRQTGINIANNFADGLESGVGAVDKAASQLAQAAGQIGPQVDKYLSANSPEYSEAKRIGGEVVSSISQGITNAQGEIGRAMDGVNKFISDPLGEIDKALSANIPGYDVAKKQAQEFVTGVETTMSGLSEAAKVGTDEFQKIIAEEFVLPPMDQVIAKAQEIGDGIGAALMGDPSKIASTMDGIGSAISSKIGVVSGKVGAVMDQVNQTMRDKVPGFADAQDKAIEFGNGLAAGVENARLQMNTQLSSMGLPTIPTPQMAIDGVAAEVAKVQTAIGTGLNSMLIQAPAPIVPAPNMTALDQAVNAIGSIAPPPIIASMMPDFESLLKITEKEIPAIGEKIAPLVVNIGANPEAFIGALNSIGGLAASGIGVAVPITGDFTNLLAAVPALPAVPLPVTPDLAALNTGLAMGGLPPIQLPVTPDLSTLNTGLAMVGIPPVSLPVIPDTTSLAAGLSTIIAPPIPVDMVVNVPQLPTFPNTTSNHMVQVNAEGLPIYPDTSSINAVQVIAEALPLYDDTESTHTVKVDVEGAKGIPGARKAAKAGTRSIPNNAMGSMGNISGISSASMGVPMGINSGSIGPMGTVGLGIAGGLAIGGLLLGLGSLFAGLFAILGAFSKNVGKLKPNDIDGGSYRPEGVINHYYYQTTQNNHFDGGLVGDPELQGKRVLEVLQSAPNGRQFRNQLGAST